MIFLESGIEIIIPRVGVLRFLHRSHKEIWLAFARVVFEFGHVVGSMSALKSGVGS